MSTCFGFEILGPLNRQRRLVNWEATFSEYAALTDGIDANLESYVSAFTFGEDFRTHLESTGSVRGFNGFCAAEYVWFDIDRPDLEVARRDAARLALFLIERYRLDDGQLLFFFSGFKGFHIGLPTKLWEPTASESFHRMARRMVETLAKATSVAIDAGVYDKVRAFRAPNSRHPKSGLHKRALTLDELTRLSVKRIKELAKEPTPFDLPTVSTRCKRAEADWKDACRFVDKQCSPLVNRVIDNVVKSHALRQVDKNQSTTPPINPVGRRKGSNATDRTESTSVRSVLSVQQLNLLIEETLPPAFGTRRNKLFILARCIHADSELREIPLSDLKPMLRAWHQKALPNIEHKDFDWTWAQFVEAYRNVDPARCIDAVDEAMKRADASELPPEALQYDSLENRRLVALCAVMSRDSKDGVFFLSCRKAAKVIGMTDHTQAARMLKMITADQILMVTKPGGPDTNKATRYRYLPHGTGTNR
jgi:hypothetical protein